MRREPVLSKEHIGRPVEKLSIPPVQLVKVPRPQLFHAVIRYRDFRLFWLAALTTQLGQWCQVIALGWVALNLTDSPAFVGRVGFAGGIPVLMLSLPAGVLLDRVDRRRALLACQTLAAALALIVAAVIIGQRLTPQVLLLAAALGGALLAVAQPAAQTLVPALVPREDMANALALSSAANSATRIIGPSLAGLLIVAVGPAGPFVMQGIALLIAAGLTRAVRPRPDGAAARAGVRGGFLDGLRLIRHDPALTGLLLYAATLALLAFPYVQLVPVLARDYLGLGPQGLGLLMATSGVGAVHGTLAVVGLGGYRHKGQLLVAASIVYGVVIVAFVQSPWPLLAAPISALSSLLGSFAFSLITVLLQTSAPDAMRGRLMGALTLTFGLSPVGALIIGELATSIGTPHAISVAVLLSSLAVALLALLFRPLARL
ncbi:MAG: hypothetical protein AVDCRST_MAG88-3774 [uncultured Thermomicrobiales bacterium]|uniref:Major facilitator superfamily (MFS) profile domain-containing protein n=1 Tax=uncultured Thermomicrobiales bacterium TaxID=1645740 RepID=A0A6J4VTN8_9BACT|nr:MAG: hypothetical protein AVDCRST_MAG88-3774 [uncultured Thermomicrobiales bacterium]